VKLLFAWQGLVHNKPRAVITVASISLSIILIFVQLGLYDAVFRTATLVQDRMDFDLVLLSPSYQYVVKPGSFPRRRLIQARAVPGVESAAPLYVGIQPWSNEATHRRWRIFIMAVNPQDRVFLVPEIEAQLPALQRADTILVDRETRPEFGAHEVGQTTELGTRQVAVVGNYTLGTGFLSNGALVTSDQNFSRLFDGYPLENVNVGLVRVTPGAVPEEVARRLRETLPPDVRILTRAELNAQEKQYWATQTSVGLIFGFGTAVAILVGIVILYQVLATDLRYHLPEYATLKAMGYQDRTLSRMVLHKVCLLSLLAYVPALPLALGVYAITRATAKLPTYMTGTRVVAVLALTLLMGSLSGFLAMRKLRTANPADLY
jgi:putative ABC transport system permease protein